MAEKTLFELMEEFRIVDYFAELYSTSDHRPHHPPLTAILETEIRPNAVLQWKFRSEDGWTFTTLARKEDPSNGRRSED